MWVEYNPNPNGRRVGDCAVRAVSAALGIDWESAFCLLANAAFQMGDMPSSDSVSSAVLRMHGFKRQAVPDTCPDCYTAEMFAEDHPDDGVYVLYFGGHVATIVPGGYLLDSWDSSQLIPQFYWYRRENEHGL